MTTVLSSTPESALRVLERWSARGGEMRPTRAMLEISDRCNEVCVHCYQVQGQKGEMSTEQLERVMDELADMGVLLLTFSGGEATLRKDFLELVAYARRKRFVVKLFTNGLRITRALAERLGELAVAQVQITLYSVRPETHDWFTGVPGSWVKTVAAVRHLVAAGVPVLVKSTLMTVNAREYEGYIRFARELGADWQIAPTQMFGREDGDRSPEAFQCQAPEARAFLSDPVLERYADGARASQQPERPPDRSLSSSPCGACTSVHVEPNGDVRPCTQLQLTQGNALSEGVRNSFYSEQARALRALSYADLHGCRDCDLRSYCKRCYAQSLVSSGDALGPYEAACQGALHSYQAIHGPHLELVARADGTTGGPYRVQRDGRPRCVQDRLTEHDFRLRRAHRWAYGGEVQPKPAPATAGQLVQIRRPGKRSRAEVVAGGDVPGRPDRCIEEEHVTSSA